MSMTKANDPAFPSDDHDVDLGITKREYFAASFMPGLLNGNYKSGYGAAARAVELADELIKELNKPSKKVEISFGKEGVE